MTLLVTFLFVVVVVGPAVSATANNINTQIGSRDIEGIGGGGVSVLLKLIVCDLVPLRDRSKFIGVIFIDFAFAVSIDLTVGGTIAQ